MMKILSSDLVVAFALIWVMMTIGSQAVALASNACWTLFLFASVVWGILSVSLWMSIGTTSLVASVLDSVPTSPPSKEA